MARKSSAVLSPMERRSVIKAAKTDLKAANNELKALNKSEAAVMKANAKTRAALEKRVTKLTGELALMQGQ